MRELFGQVREHLVEDFDPVIYGFAAAQLVAVLYLHYGAGWIDLSRPPEVNPVRFVQATALYVVPWGLVTTVLYLRGRVRVTPRFFVAAAVGLTALGLLEWWPFHPHTMLLVQEGARPWVGNMLWWVKGIAAYLVPLGLFWLLSDRHDLQPFYGWKLDAFDPRPYLIPAALLVLIAGIASFESSFQSYYPSYRPGRSEAYLGISAWVTVPLYQLVYGAQFAAVETFFRGFFVIGMARWLGRTAVIPMITVYCVLHLGKPFGEALTSIFGGYCLGVWAYRNRCMLEGVLLHLALAWSMDGFALLQRALR